MKACAHDWKVESFNRTEHSHTTTYTCKKCGTRKLSTHTIYAPETNTAGTKVAK